MPSVGKLQKSSYSKGVLSGDWYNPKSQTRVPNQAENQSICKYYSTLSHKVLNVRRKIKYYENLTPTPGKSLERENKYISPNVRRLKSKYESVESSK